MVIRNEEAILSDCLNDIKNFVHEIVIVDQSSTDGSLRIARQFTQKVYIRPHSNFCETDRQFSIDQASYPWILVLDPCEKLDMKLKSNLHQLISSGLEAFWIPSKATIDGRHYDLGGEDLQLRFFKKNVAHWPQVVHAHPTLDTSKVGKIEDGFIIHSRSLDRVRTVHEDRDLYANERVVKRQNGFVGKVDKGLNKKAKGEPKPCQKGPEAVSDRDIRPFDLTSHLKDLEACNPLMTDEEARYRLLYELSKSG